MKLLLSPAKTFNETLQNNGNDPLFLETTERLLKKLTKLSVSELSELYACSEKIAVENTLRYQQWKSTIGGAAIRMFGGEVYKQLNCETMSFQMFERVKCDVLMLSGLYGILRAEDRIQPYRLDPKDRVSINGKSLIDSWKPKITRYLMNLDDHDFVLLCSQEYEDLIDLKKLSSSKRFIRMVFMEQENNIRSVKGMYAKTARVKFARTILENQIDSINELKKLSIDSYCYEDAISDEINFVYVRTKCEAET